MMACTGKQALPLPFARERVGGEEVQWLEESPSSEQWRVQELRDVPFRWPKVARTTIERGLRVQHPSLLDGADQPAIDGGCLIQAPVHYQAWWRYGEQLPEQPAVLGFDFGVNPPLASLGFDGDSRLAWCSSLGPYQSGMAGPFDSSGGPPTFSDSYSYHMGNDGGEHG